MVDAPTHTDTGLLIQVSSKSSEGSLSSASIAVKETTWIERNIACRALTSNCYKHYVWHFVSSNIQVHRRDVWIVGGCFKLKRHRYNIVDYLTLCGAICLGSKNI